MISITLTYLCQTAVCWAVLLVFYELFLRKSTHYHLSRLYLLSALILGAVIPLLPNFFTTAPEFVYSFQGSLEGFVVVVDAYTAPQVEQLVDWPLILQSFYVIIASILLFRIAFGIYKITQIKPIRKTNVGAIEINFHQKDIQPFSFINKIFIPKGYPEQYQQIVLAHEIAHVKQGHSVDIIVSRAIAALFWINPMTRIFERYLKEVHEHFADQITLANYDLKTYQGALRFSAFSSVGLRMAQAFNSNNIRKRLQNMKKSNSSISTKFLYSAILPIGLFLSMAMNTYDVQLLSTALNNIKENTGKLLASTTGADGESHQYSVVDTIPPPPPPNPPYPPAILGNQPPMPPPSPPSPPSPPAPPAAPPAPPPPPSPNGRSLHDLVSGIESSQEDVSEGISLKGNFNDPLVDIDGVVFNPKEPSSNRPAYITPEEIESVNVLKGEQAIAIYGAKGANGVIIIKRKKGSQEQSPHPGSYPAKVTSSAEPIFLKENLLYSEVDELPRFPGCEDAGDKEKVKHCAMNKMIEFLGSHIKYPEKAKKYGVDGVVMIQFTVTYTGEIHDAIITRNVGYGCGEEALRVVNIMNEKAGLWIPGKKNGKPVHVQFNLPVKFKIDRAASSSTDNDNNAEAVNVADVMPRFPGCEEYPNNQMEACAKKNLLSYIYKNVKYPAVARTNGIQGTVVVQYVVNTEGYLEQIELVKDIGGGCGDEAVRVVNLMNQEGIRWESGIHNDKRVNVKFNLPIHFKLENNSVKSQTIDEQGDEIYKIVKQKPRFPGCEDVIGSQAEKEACAMQAMLEFLYSNVKYPEVAKNNNTEGTTVIQFIVEKDGSISGAKIVRDVKDGCGLESLRVVNLMNQMEEKWTPGMQQGKPVRVQYNLPVKFKLTSDEEKKDNKVIGEF